MEFEIRYTVLKNTDIERYLDDNQKIVIESICQSIKNGRKQSKRDEFGCIVIEQDWPEFGPTLRRLSQRVDLEVASDVCKRNSHLARYPR